MSGYRINPFLQDRDRRNGERRPARLRAWADPGGAAPVVDCLVVELSEGGASVVALGGAELPDAFRLQLDMKRILGEAEVKWRKGPAAGIELAAPKAKG